MEGWFDCFNAAGLEVFLSMDALTDALDFLKSVVFNLLLSSLRNDVSLCLLGQFWVISNRSEKRAVRYIFPACRGASKTVSELML